jgi:Tfp pilus assembly protein PilN
MTGTRRVNLLPREIRERRRARQRVATVVAAAVGVIVILVGAYVIQAVRLHSEQNKLDAQNEQNNALKSRIAALTDFDRLNKELDAKSKLVASLTQDEVRWSVLLADVSIVIPSDAWLGGFTGNVTAAAGAGGSLGSIQMNGTTFTHLDVAKWLTRLDEVDAFLSPYLTLSTKAAVNGVETVNFNSSVQLSAKAFRQNQPGAQRKI